MTIDRATVLEETAFHEAGHAVMGCIVGRYPVSVTIVPDGPIAGKTEFEPGVPSFARRYLDESPEKRAYTQQRVLTELAGSIAHDLFRSGRTLDRGDETDLHWARELMIDLVSWQDHDAYLEQARAKATVLLKEHWQWVETVACALLDRKSLSRAELMTLRPL